MQHDQTSVPSNYAFDFFPLRDPIGLHWGLPAFCRISKLSDYSVLKIGDGECVGRSEGK